MTTVGLADYKRSSTALQIAGDVMSHIAFYAAMKSPYPLHPGSISLRLSSWFSYSLWEFVTIAAAVQTFYP